MSQNVTIDWLPPHSQKQYDMMTCPENVAAFCGRRFGKTEAGVGRLFYFGINDPGLYWWVGLSWRSASMKRAWRLITDYTRLIWQQLEGEVPNGVIKVVDKEVYLPNGTIFWLRSSENPDSLAGEGIKGAVVDEFTLMAERVYTEFLEGTLIDYNAWVAMFGIPKGNNWAAMKWRESAFLAGWRQFHATSYDNPFMPVEKIEQIKDETPELMFQQEYMAEIIAGQGQVFRNITDCVYDGILAFNPNYTYVMGVDWGQQNDFTVLTVGERETGCIVAVERFNQISWDTQRERLMLMAKLWDVTEILAEENNMTVMIEGLQDMGLPVTPFWTSSKSKQEAVQALVLAFERGEISIPDDQILIQELESFEQKRSLSGWKYEAPEGMHDDMVMSLVFVWQLMLYGDPFRGL